MLKCNKQNTALLISFYFLMLLDLANCFLMFTKLAANALRWFQCITEPRNANNSLYTMLIYFRNKAAVVIGTLV